MKIHKVTYKLIYHIKGKGSPLHGRNRDGITMAQLMKIRGLLGEDWKGGTKLFTLDDKEVVDEKLIKRILQIPTKVAINIVSVREISRNPRMVNNYAQ